MEHLLKFEPPELPSNTMVATEKKTPEKKIVKPKKAAVLEAPVYSLKGVSTKNEALPADIFGQEPNDLLVAHYVRVYLNNQRQGNASAKTRTEVVGTTKKIYRQKGTGRARHGAAKANLFRGGGVTFGPLTKDFNMSINKKQKKQALFATLSQKARNAQIRIVDAEAFGDKPQTKQIAELMKVMKVDGKVLFVMSQVEDNAVVKSIRNISKCDIIQSTTINAYEVLNHKDIIFINDAVTVLSTHFLTQ